MTNTQIPMPAELQNLRPPTRQDAIAYRARGWRTIPRFEDTMRGQQCAKGMYRAETCEEYRADFDKKEEAAITDAMLGCQREYEEALEHRRQIEAHNAGVVEAETQALRARYMAGPGATEEAFQKALPELLEARRREQALTGSTAVEDAIDAMRDRVRL